MNAPKQAASQGLSSATDAASVGQPLDGVATDHSTVTDSAADAGPVASVDSVDAASSTAINDATQSPLVEEDVSSSGSAIENLNPLVTQGIDDADLTPVAPLAQPEPDPELVESDVRAEPAVVRAPLYFQGPGDPDEVAMDDVMQQYIPDCWILAPLAEIALQDPQMIKNMIKDNSDGTYTVTFKERLLGGFGIDPKYTDRPITVNADMPPAVALPFPGGLVMGTPHAAAGDLNLFHKGEIWPQIVEKAYAGLKGGWDKIYNDGHAYEFMEAMTGRPATLYRIGQILGALALPFDELMENFVSRKPIVVCTADKVSNAHLIRNHCYAVHSLYTDADGKQLMSLYNPWGRKHTTIAYDSLYPDVDSIVIG